MTAIRPTIATGVLFYPTTSFAAEQDIAVRDIGEPLDAQVTRVHSDREVDLLVIDLEGKKHKILRVDFVQNCSQAPEGDGGQVSANYCIPLARDDGDLSVEQEIQGKGLTAPRVTPADIEANIVSEHYFTAGDGVMGAVSSQDEQPHYVSYDSSLDLLTFCVLVLKNGFTVTGESACASPENFDPEIGRKIARQNAEQKIWPLMGYELKQRLHEGSV